MYHLPVADPPSGGGPVLPSLCISPRTLREQLRQLARAREVVSMDEALRWLASPPGEATGRRERDPAVVTFDDGYAGVHEHALPILRELRLPAIAYVPTAYVGTDHRLLHDRLHASLAELGGRRLDLAQAGLARPQQALLDRYAAHPAAALDRLIRDVPHEQLVALADALEGRLGLDERALPAPTRLMSWEQLADLKAAGIDVGGHTVHHVELVNVPLARARAEIQGCRRDIAERLGSPPRHFAYPNGYYTPQVREAVADTGFVSAVTGQDRARHRGADVFALKRRVLWEASTAGPWGFSSALAACYFDDTFAVLGLQREYACEQPDAEELLPSAESA
jgi:peptidoglycan/xylan/chitin deacetylase (PgdA/CDA1 family)